MQHPIVSHDEWLAVRKELLERGKELTRLRDQLAVERRALPWVKIEEPCLFDGAEGERTRVDVVGGRSERIHNRFMLVSRDSDGRLGCLLDRDHGVDIL